MLYYRKQIIQTDVCFSESTAKQSLKAEPCNRRRLFMCCNRDVHYYILPLSGIFLFLTDFCEQISGRRSQRIGRNKARCGILKESCGRGSREAFLWLKISACKANALLSGSIFKQRTKNSRVKSIEVFCVALGTVFITYNLISLISAIRIFSRATVKQGGVPKKAAEKRMQSE